MKHSPAEEIKDDTSKISSARNQALGNTLPAGLKTQAQIEENETGPALVAKGALTQENPERFWRWENKPTTELKNGKISFGKNLARPPRPAARE
jgi:hypothetical protein